MSTKSFAFAFTSALLVASAALPGCSKSDDNKQEPEPATCDPAAAKTGCHTGRVCEAVVDGDAKCFDAYTIQGRVFDTLTDKGIAGANIVARDVNGAAVSSVAVSGPDGKYKLPVPMTRNADGTAQATTYEVLLRADAAKYVSFPKPPRTALPIDVAKATGTPPVLQTAATDIALVPIENATGLGAISGKVIADNPGGTLVVAGGSTAIADRKGAFTLFNVAAGSATVRGYLLGVNLEEKTVDVAADKTTEGVELNSIGQATAIVSGAVSFVDVGATNPKTSVILAVEDTFVETVARGETPPGLKDPEVLRDATTGNGTFEIPNVPDGKYVVLAAFENDDLVRDPDTSQGGTAIVHITVSGANVPVADSFKITEALAVQSPDNEAEVSGKPTFVWADDAGESSYEIVVFDARGNQIWEKKGIPPVSGATTVTQAYEGDLSALISGMIYQFKATSIKQGGAPLSTTEDLKGVFIYK